jgi:hypothetical protein
MTLASSSPTYNRDKNIKESGIALRQQCRYNPLFSVPLSGGNLSVSWNDLIFWHCLVDDANEGIHGAGESKSNGEDGQGGIGMSKIACLEALMAAKRYSRGT